MPGAPGFSSKLKRNTALATRAHSLFGECGYEDCVCQGFYDRPELFRCKAPGCSVKVHYLCQAQYAEDQAIKLPMDKAEIEPWCPEHLEDQPLPLSAGRGGSRDKRTKTKRKAMFRRGQPSTTEHYDFNAHETILNMKRLALRNKEKVIEVLKKWCQVDNPNNFITKEHYQAASRRIQKTLVQEQDYVAADEDDFEDDWAVDSQGEEYMAQSTFMDAIFELAHDNAQSITEEAYADCLEALLWACSMGWRPGEPVRNKRPTWRALKQIKPYQGQASNTEQREFQTWFNKQAPGSRTKTRVSTYVVGKDGEITRKLSTAVDFGDAPLSTSKPPAHNRRSQGNKAERAGPPGEHGPLGPVRSEPSLSQRWSPSPPPLSRSPARRHKPLPPTLPPPDLTISRHDFTSTSYPNHSVSAADELDQDGSRRPAGAGPRARPAELPSAGSSTERTPAPSRQAASTPHAQTARAAPALSSPSPWKPNQFERISSILKSATSERDAYASMDMHPMLTPVQQRLLRCVSIVEPTQGRTSIPGMPGARASQHTSQRRRVATLQPVQDLEPKIPSTSKSFVDKKNRTPTSPPRRQISNKVQQNGWTGAASPMSGECS